MDRATFAARARRAAAAGAIACMMVATFATGSAAGSEPQAKRGDASPSWDSAPTLVDDVLIPEDGRERSASLAMNATAERPTYDVVFFRIDTATEQSGLTSASAQELTERAHAWWAEATNEAAPVLRYRGMRTVTSPQESVCGLDEAEDAVGQGTLEALRPSAGADEVLYVLVSPDTGCASAGVAWLGVLGLWVAYDDRPDRLLSVTLHEMGHNFGLRHSGNLMWNGGRDVWLGDGEDWVDDYGDQADIMGYGVYYSEGPSGPFRAISGLHGLNNQRLGGISTSEIAHVDAGENRTFTLTASNSDTAGGVKLLYLPAFNRSKFVIEYRAATGVDEFIDGGPRSGVMVRMNNYGDNAGPANYDPSGVGTVVWRAGHRYSDPIYGFPLYGFTGGQTTRLPDGTQIAVNSTANGSASITVSRPPDTTPPVFDGEPFIVGCYEFTWPVSECEQLANSRGVWNGNGYWPTVYDETWAESITLEVDGETTDQLVRSAVGADGGWYDVRGNQAGSSTGVRLSVGVHTLEFVARDASGNEARVGTRLTVKADDETPVAPRPGMIRGVKVGPRGKVAIVTWKAPPAKWQVTKYQWQRLVAPGLMGKWHTIKNGSARQLKVALPRRGELASVVLRAVSNGGPGPYVQVGLPTRR